MVQHQGQRMRGVVVIQIDRCKIYSPLKYFWFSRPYHLLHRLLKNVSYHETLLFSEYWTKDLDTNRELDTRIIFWCCKSSRYRNPWNSRKRCWNGKDILQVKRNWISSFSSEFPSNIWCRWCHDNIYLSESISKILTNELPHA